MGLILADMIMGIKLRSLLRILGLLLMRTIIVSLGVFSFNTPQMSTCTNVLEWTKWAIYASGVPRSCNSMHLEFCAAGIACIWYTLQLVLCAAEFCASGILCIWNFLHLVFLATGILYIWNSVHLEFLASFLFCAAGILCISPNLCSYNSLHH